MTEPKQVKTKRIKMKGTATFNTFAYLLNGAKALAETAREHEDGSNYSRISAVLFCAFTIEAYIYHVGETKVPNWKELELDLDRRGRLDLVAQHLGIKPDLGKRPFQTLDDLSKLRDGLAHGKTTTEDKTYNHSDGESEPLDPDWLSKFWSDVAVNRVLKDTEEIIKLLHAKAGFEPHSLYVIGSGDFEQVKKTRAAGSKGRRDRP